MNNQQPKKGIIIGAIVLITIVAVYFLMRPASNNNEQNNNYQNNNSNNNNNTETLYKTVSAKELSDSDDNKEYINKKIKITGLVVTKDKKENQYIQAPGLMSYFYVSCGNESSLNIKEGDQISIIGIVEDSVWTTDHNFQIINCSVEQEKN